MTTIQPLLDAFHASFGAAATHLLRAPGRVNLIGEHTDYNAGFVLPCAIDFGTTVAIRARSDRQVKVLALDYAAERDAFSLDAPIAFKPGQMWANYIRGVVVVMQQQGYALSGCDIAVTGNVPQGAGLSSSAALEVAVCAALAAVSGLELSPVAIAKIAQAAENNFVGCACGIMDQLISASAVAGHATLIDCRDLSMQTVAIPAQLSIMIIDSRVQRGLVDSEYNARRQQCEEAAAYFGENSLRDVSLQRFEQQVAHMPAIAARRARHVIEENQRTLDTVAALQHNDIKRLSHLMAQSHCSMRDLFEITVPEIDFLVALIAEYLGERGGVRMTGGGFGGCVVALVPSELCDEIHALVHARYRAFSGYDAVVYQCQASAGMQVLHQELHQTD